jgi:hypothetical protein
MKYLRQWKPFFEELTTQQRHEFEEQVRQRKLRPIEVPLEEEPNMEDKISRALSGKARVVNIPVSGMRKVMLDQPWFTVITFKKEDEAEVGRILDDVLKTIPKYYKVNKPSDFSSDDHRHRQKLYSDLLYTVTGQRSLGVEQGSIIVFFSNEEEKVEAPQTLYHVTYSPNVEEEGIKASDTMKFSNRVYLWAGLDQAKSFAKFSFHGKQDFAWIWEVNTIGMDVYKDFEERSTSFYVSGDIAKERCRLVEKVDLK